MEPPKEQMDDIKGKILNELRVLQETYTKDRKTLTKINVTKKLKKKIELGDAALEMTILETDPDLTKYNKIIHATAKVMADMLQREFKKRTHNKQAKETNVEREDRKRDRISQGQSSILIECQYSVNVRGKACRKLNKKYNINYDGINFAKETIRQKI